MSSPRTWLTLRSPRRTPNLRIGLAGLLVAALLTPATPVSAEIAPEGSFLPAAPFETGAGQIAPPMLVDDTGAANPVGYQTRLGWLLAAAEHQQSEDPATASVEAPRVAAAIQREAESVKELGAEEAARYWAALLNDLGTIEIADRDDRWSDEVLAAAAIDLLAGYVLHAAALDLDIDARRLGSLGQARYERLVEAARLQSRGEALAAFAQLDLPPDLWEAIRAAGPNAGMLEDLAERYAQSSVPALFAIDDAGNVALGATVSTAVGPLAGLASDPDGPFGVYRQLAIDNMLLSKFGCADPLAGSFRAPQAWDIVLPGTQQQYRTSLGRILSAFGKSRIRIIDGRDRLRRAEEAAIARLPEPQRMAYLAQFLHDLESLQAEYLADMRATSLGEVLLGFATAAIAAAFGIPATGLATTTSLLASAGFAGLAAGEKISDERALMVSIAGLRRTLTDQLLAADKIAGCVDESIALVIDASGSMGDDDRMAATRDAVDKAVAAMEGRTEVALIVFYDCGDIRVEQEFTTNPALIAAAMEGVRPSGSTPLLASIEFAKQYAAEHASSKKVRTPVLTDGEDTCG